MEKNYKLIAGLAWDAFRIPVYVYQNKEMTVCFPYQENYLLPKEEILCELWKREHLSYTTSYHSIFVKLPCLKDDHICFVCGPVSSYPYTPKVLTQLHKEYFIGSEQRTQFDDFFSNIPIMTQGEFFRLMQVLYYMINDAEIKINMFLPESVPSKESKKQIDRNLQTEIIYRQKEYEYPNDSYEIENYILNIVRRGDVTEMADYISSIPAYHAGTVAHDVLRMQKNYLITITALVTRAAIDAGLPKDQAFGLSDLYITKSENLTNMQEINLLTIEMLLNFTGQVKEAHDSALVPIEIDGLPAPLLKCMSYIKSHTDQKLSVQLVAKELGYDRSYLSNLFSKTLGFSLSAYITRCKLEESKILLAYTDKSLKEIASFLCFSSQSHFQKRFRETFHVTPLGYRNRAK